MNPINKFLGFVETPFCTKKSLKKNINYSTISINNSDYKIKILRHRINKEAGASNQFSIKLKGPRLIYGRIKRIKTLNEAIIYYKINKTNDPIKEYLPPFLGVFDCKGKLIDLEKELQTKSINQLCTEYADAYLVMKDVSLKADPYRSIDDFKFARPSLIGNEQERVRHARTPHSRLYLIIRSAYFSLSKCAFAFQKNTKSNWFTWLIVSIKRLRGIKKTKARLERHFKAMDKEELTKTIGKLQELKKSITSSNFAFTDSSLLFVPRLKKVDEKEINSLKIYLIDLSHGMEKDENINDFYKIQNDMSLSIDELLDILNDCN